MFGSLEHAFYVGVVVCFGLGVGVIFAREAWGGLVVPGGLLDGAWSQQAQNGGFAALELPNHTRLPAEGFSGV